MEEWKNIEGFEGYYQISNKGRVRSCKRKVFNGKGKALLEPRIRNLELVRSGYLRVTLHKKNKPSRFLAHRLVLDAFKGPAGNLEANHINEIKTDNRIENLEWVSKSENCSYGKRTKKIAAKTRNGKLSKPVFQLDLNGNTVKEWPSLSEAGRNGFTPGHISKCCNGINRTHGGFKWKYSE